MGEISRANEESTRIVSALLSFVAGYVDSFTFITLFGLFVANVTGSFVIAGAEIVKNDPSWIGKLLAIAAFFLAAFLTAAFIACARQRGWPALMWTIMLETFFLAAFVALVLPGAPLTDPNDWRGIAAGLLAAMAMGSQSALVRLLMPGVPQTNVMTGNPPSSVSKRRSLFLRGIDARASREMPRAGRGLPARESTSRCFLTLR